VHAPLRRDPHAVLARLAAALPEGTPPDGPEGPVAVLERRVADLLGVPAALFFPTGAMAQQVALRIHADDRGRRVVAGHPASHVAVHEEWGLSAVHGLVFRPVGDPHRLVGLEDLRRVAEPLAAVTWELPQRDLGGRLPEWDDLVAQVAWARGRGAAVHLDGARLWEASTGLPRPIAEVAGLFDTVYVSLYKGLEAPRGAVLAGPADVVAQAGVWRLRLGGALPEAWPLAAAGLLGLDELLPRMPLFRDHARALAAAIAADGVATVVPDPPQTPLFHVHLPAPPDAVTAAHQRLVEATGTQLFLRVRTAPDPGRCSFEVTVGENALQLAPEEVARLVRELVQSARG
jgi:threonine aldolase